MRILALFDDGSQSVKKALREHEVISVGINEKSDVVLDLSEMSNIPKIAKMHADNPFNLVMASPPCESWSFSTASTGGNAYRYSDSLKLKNFTEWKANTYNNVKKVMASGKNPLPYFERYYKTGVNGEMTALFTAEIIKALGIPFVIENPQSSMIFRYLEMLNLTFERNLATYCSYDSERNLKPTIFASNQKLNLKQERNATVTMKELKGRGDGSARAEIPYLLVQDIVRQMKC